MTVSAYSTDFPIEVWRPERPNEVPVSDMSHAAIITSLHGRSGKTLLARTLVDYFLLSGGRPYVFDTDSVEWKLDDLFPSEARVVDLAIARDQMVLFDTLAKPSSEMRVVDLTHRSLTKFFALLRDTDFICEAKAHNIEPTIYYIPDRKLDSFEAGVVLRDTFPDCAFIVVENGVFEPPKHNVRQSSAYDALRSHTRRFIMPKLEADVIEVLEDQHLSIGDFMRQPMSSTGETSADDGLSSGVRIELRRWVFRMFREIHRVTAGLPMTDEPLSSFVSASQVTEPEDWGRIGSG
jgi:hypothetical protein